VPGIFYGLSDTQLLQSWLGCPILDSHAHTTTTESTDIMTNTTHVNVYPSSADGKELEQWRKEQGLTQDQLGKIIGYSGKAIRTWETGRYMPRYDAVSKLATLGFRFSRLDRMRAAVTDNPTCDPRRNPSPPAEPASSVSDSPNSDYTFSRTELAEHATGDSSQPPKPVAPAPGSVDLSQVAQALELAHAVRSASAENAAPVAGATGATHHDHGD
jgi:DNA-binding XRE family transcriptional regulator